jgi:GntR family transcriptional regulator, arabinose operon transcriptional repressor
MSTEIPSTPVKPQAKYRQIYQFILDGIQNKVFPPNQKLPSDLELSRKLLASRMTVIRALNDLQSQGIVRRRAGSGTFVCEPSKSGRHTFGLLIPDLGATEIFEPICRGMAQAGELTSQALLWGNTTAGSDHGKGAQELCRFFISEKVSGVFFAPLEFDSNKDVINQWVVEQLDEAKIPVVLLDRCVKPFPHRSRYDLIGIDNRRAGYRMAEHLMNLGCKVIAFVAKPGSASTVSARIAGHRDAHFARGLPYRHELVQCLDPSDMTQVQQFHDHHRPEAIVCANDATAGRLMQSLIRLGIRIPGQTRIVGIDDVKYAHLLPVPLTTLRQPCLAMGSAAITAMMERIAKPDMVPRDILLECELIVRRSCGSNPEEIDNIVHLSR